MSLTKPLLVVRSDRLGDVLLSLPSLTFLRKVFPDAPVDFYCHDEYQLLLAPWLRKHSIKGVGFHDNSVRALKKILDGQRYHGILFLHATPQFLFASKLSHVPVRAGIYSKAASFFCLSDGLRQTRSTSTKNEAVYNLELTQHFAQSLGWRGLPLAPDPILLDPGPEHIEGAQAWLKERNIREGEFLVLHPGMGGSGLNVSIQEYQRIIRYVKDALEHPILVSEGPGDSQYVHSLEEGDPSLRVIRGVPLARLAAFFKLSSLVIAPSTGPLHLAHLVGTKTLGLFSPVRSHAASRWAPFGGVNESTVCFPKIACPGIRACIGSSCKYFNCMENLGWQSELNRLFGLEEKIGLPETI